MTNIAMENGPFIDDDVPIETSIIYKGFHGFSMAMLNNQMVCMKITPQKNTNMYFQDGIDDDCLKTFQVSNSCDPFWGSYI